MSKFKPFFRFWPHSPDFFTTVIDRPSTVIVFDCYVELEQLPPSPVRIGAIVQELWSYGTKNHNTCAAVPIPVSPQPSIVWPCGVQWPVPHSDRSLIRPKITRLTHFMSFRVAMLVMKWAQIVPIVSSCVISLFMLNMLQGHKCKLFSTLIDVFETCEAHYIGVEWLVVS